MGFANRYWNALDDASRKAIKKAAFTALGLGIVLMIAYFIVYFDALFLGTMGESAALQLAVWPVFMLGAIAISIYGCVLVYRAHRTIKENLFAHPATGLRTRETWTHVDGILLALALFGLTSIPAALVRFAMDLMLSQYSFYEPSALPSALFWPVVGLILAPIAAKRYIPLSRDDQNSAH